MATRKQQSSLRGGAAAVEVALIMLPLFVLIFGIFEYSRLIMDRNLLNNAAREGCRYALVNNTSTTISSDVQGIVTNRMAGEDSHFSSFTVTVTGTHQGASTPINDLGPGDLITVTVTGNYKFMNIIPMVPMPSTLTMTSAVTMVCEGGT
jgi:Flp pilus assembly protein TadG